VLRNHGFSRVGCSPPARPILVTAAVALHTEGGCRIINPRALFRLGFRPADHALIWCHLDGTRSTNFAPRRRVSETGVPFLRWSPARREHVPGPAQEQVVPRPVNRVSSRRHSARKCWALCAISSPCPARRNTLGNRGHIESGARSGVAPRAADDSFSGDIHLADGVSGTAQFGRAAACSHVPAAPRLPVNGFARDHPQTCGVNSQNLEGLWHADEDRPRERSHFD